ncbi:hypothetical protein AURDEDRAFT_109772 [Auricularia subglabra TFB-10046 SS5]|nr:hypothetical protein AURDEDRAFT_109772 [Auricularia subglabra TFB-10046 SS5]
MPHRAMDKVQVVAKQQYSQELAAYTLMQWNVARGAAEAQGKPALGRRVSSNELPSPQRRHPLARSRSAMSPAGAASVSEPSTPATGTAAGSSPSVKAVDYAPVSSSQSFVPAVTATPQSSQSQQAPAPTPDAARRH